MKLNTIQNIQKAQSAYKTRKPSLGSLKPLNNDEQKMINEQFPKATNDKLQLYMANGNNRMEMPGAKGKNFDFRF